MISFGLMHRAVNLFLELIILKQILNISRLTHKLSEVGSNSVIMREHYFLIFILEKEPVFPFSMLSAKQGNHWYHLITSLV